jgi:hypothetical protein
MTPAVLGTFLAVSRFTLEVQQFAVRDKDSKANPGLLDIVTWIGCHAVWVLQVQSVFVFAELSFIYCGKVLLCSCLVPRAMGSRCQWWLLSRGRPPIDPF